MHDVAQNLPEPVIDYVKRIQVGCAPELSATRWEGFLFSGAQPGRPSLWRIRLRASEVLSVGDQPEV